jgi:putative glutamine amidotransferase
MSEPAARAPRILVTTGDPARSHNPELSAVKVGLYVEAIRRHGGEPSVIDSRTPAGERARLLSQMAGLLLTGGADVDPALYHEPRDGSQDVDADRDALEMEAWGEAERRGLPVFGICRGLQAINVFAGGSVVQDVPDHAGTPYGDGPARTHNMSIDPDSRLARAIASAAPEGLAATDGSDTSIELVVNTFHHQAIVGDRLAPGLRAVGWAASAQGRLVEAAESRDDRWVVGIQCHPERTDSTPAELEGLFEDFVRAVREASVEPVL